MRRYIASVRYREDHLRDSVVDFDFGGSLQSAGTWKTLDQAEYECAAFNRLIQVKTEGPLRGFCSDFRVERRAECEFVISCEAPL
jgi:hypothetical protein